MHVLTVCAYTTIYVEATQELVIQPTHQVPPPPPPRVRWYYYFPDPLPHSTDTIVPIASSAGLIICLVVRQ